MQRPEFKKFIMGVCHGGGSSLSCAVFVESE